MLANLTQNFNGIVRNPLKKLDKYVENSGKVSGQLEAPRSPPEADGESPYAR
jgi:hypothetical protein